MRCQVVGADIRLDFDDSPDPNAEFILANEMNANQPPGGGESVRCESLTGEWQARHGRVVAGSRDRTRRIRTARAQGNIATMSAGSRKPVLWTRTGMIPSRSEVAMCDWLMKMSWSWRT